MAKPRGLGADLSFLAAFEATYGDPVDGSAGGVFRQLLVQNFNVSAAKPISEEALLGQGRSSGVVFYDPETVQGSFAVPLDVQAIGFWLKGLLGDPATTGVGPYTHVWLDGDDVPSLTIDEGHPLLTVPKFYEKTGLKLGGFTHEMGRSGLANLQIDNVIAQGEARNGTAADASPLSYAFTQFQRTRGSIEVGGALLANVTGGSVTFSNGLEAVETIRPDGLIDGADDGVTAVGGTIDLRFSDDTALEIPVEGETPVELEYGYTRPASTDEIKFRYPRVFLSKPQRPIEGPGGISQSFTWIAERDSVLGAKMEVTLVNGVSNY